MSKSVAQPMPKGKPGAPAQTTPRAPVSKLVAKAGATVAKASNNVASASLGAISGGHANSTAPGIVSSPSAAYPKAPPDKPRFSGIGYTGPPGPSRDAALRARPKAVGDPVDSDETLRRFSFDNMMALPMSPPPEISLAEPSRPSLSNGLARVRSPTEESRSGSHETRSGSHETITKAPPLPKKRSAPSKKRRPGNITTRPQPFSFSTSKGRRTRHNGTIVEEDGAEDGRMKQPSAKARPKYIVPKSVIQPVTPPQPSASTASATSDDLREWVTSAASSVPSSSSEHWEQRNESAPATSMGIANIGSNSTMTNVPSTAPSLATSPFRSKPSQLSRHSQDFDGSHGVPQSPLRPIFDLFSTSGPSSQPIRSAREQRNARCDQDQRRGSRRCPDHPGGSDDAPEDEVSSAPNSAEQPRSTSILRGRLGSHLARSPQNAEHSIGERETERHVSFCSDRNVEVVQFSVQESSPNTTRVARRVFGGGDLQVGLGSSGNAPNNTSNARHQGFSPAAPSAASGRGQGLCAPAQTAAPSASSVGVCAPARPCIHDLAPGS